MNPVRESREAVLRRLRWTLGFFIAALVLSGITAFPLRMELDLLSRMLGVAHLAPDQAGSGLGRWILTVRDGLRSTYDSYPWLGYGTDWLAFGHIVIAIFFIGPLRDPVRNVWVVKAGLIACGLVIPLALICGEVRQIPLGWRLIDCSFGVLGAWPLIYALKLMRQLEGPVHSLAGTTARL